MFQHALAVFIKEIREILRDRRTVMGVFVFPAVMMMIMVSALGSLSSSLSKPTDTPVGIIGSNRNSLTAVLTSSNVRDSLHPYDSVDEGLAALKSGKIRLLLEIPADYDQQMAAGKANITVHYDKQATMSMIALGSLTKAVSMINLNASRLSFEQHELPPGLAQPLKTNEVDENKTTGLGASPVASIIPYLAVLFAYTAVMSTASDMVAGEKERGTMETLLVSPPKRTALALGKWMALFAISMCGGLVSVLALCICGAMQLPGTKDFFPAGSSLSPLALAEMICLMAPLAAMYASLTMVVSSFARSMRESQTYLGVLNLIIIAPAVASQFIGFTGMDKSPSVRWTPVLANSLGIKDALDGKAEWPLLLPCIVMCLAIAAAAFALALSRFYKESFLKRA